jgi:hypothetical protein
MVAPYGRVIAGLVLAGMILVIFWPLQYAGFINYDDNLYVFENNRLAAGFTWENIKWAFQDYSTGYWHPLTWLTLILDYRLHGMDAGGYHWTSVLIHMIASLALFVAFFRMTKALGKSFFVAAFFAIHPLHVESVAWISERKDVLSAFFFAASLWAYARYVEKRTWLTYGAVLLLFLMGLMAKPMLVTLPCLLLLLDYWPFRRYQTVLSSGTGAILQKGVTLLVEKIPFLIFSLVVSVLTFWTAKQMGGVISLQQVPFPHRLQNAILSYGTYIRKMVFPTDLAVFYPYPETIAVVPVLISPVL